MYMYMKALLRFGVIIPGSMSTLMAVPDRLCRASLSSYSVAMKGLVSNHSRPARCTIEYSVCWYYSEGIREQYPEDSSMLYTVLNLILRMLTK